MFIEAHLAQTAAEPLVPVDVLANYIAGSLLALVTWWLESEMPHPAEEMVVYYHQLVAPGVAQVMGINVAQIST